MTTTTTEAAAKLAPDSPDLCAYLCNRQQIICTQAEAESFCEITGEQLANVIDADTFKRLETHLFTAYHFDANEGLGQLYRTFHGRPDGFAMNTDDEATTIICNLKPEDIAHAVAPERGEYRGFAALHDRFDANMILPECEKLPINNEAVLGFYNALMDEVTRRLLALPPFPPASFESADAAELGGRYGDDHGPSDQVLVYHCEGFNGENAPAIVCTVDEAEEYEQDGGESFDSDVIEPAQYAAFLEYLETNVQRADAPAVPVVTVSEPLLELAGFRQVFIDGAPAGIIRDAAPSAEAWQGMHANTRAAYLAAGFTPAQPADPNRYVAPLFRTGRPPGRPSPRTAKPPLPMQKAREAQEAGDGHASADAYSEERLSEALATLRAALEKIAGESPESEPEEEEYDDMESAYNNGHDVAAWHAAEIAREALRAIAGEQI